MALGGMRLCAALVMLVALGEVQAQRIHADGFEESCLVDTDEDRLVNCLEAARNTSLTDPDTDDDGLTDGDEVLGTIGGLNLPAFGVNPRHKDLLVEMDWDDDARNCNAHSHRPTAETVAEVKIFFAASPISNPDGVDGINFIADFGQGPPPFTGGNVVEFANAVTTPLQQPF